MTAVVLCGRAFRVARAPFVGIIRRVRPPVSLPTVFARERDRPRRPMIVLKLDTFTPLQRYEERGKGRWWTR